MVRFAAVVVLVVLSACNQRMASEPSASLVFSLHPAAGAEERRAVAIGLWRTGVVDRVEPDNRLYRVFLRSPQNFLHLDQVQRVLEENPSVGEVQSLLTYVRQSGR